MMNQVVDKTKLSKIKYVYYIYLDSKMQYCCERRRVLYINKEKMVVDIPGSNDFSIVRLDNVYTSYDEAINPNTKSWIFRDPGIYFMYDPSATNASNDENSALSEILKVKYLYKYDAALKVAKSNRLRAKALISSANICEGIAKQHEDEAKDLYDKIINAGISIPEEIPNI